MMTKTYAFPDLHGRFDHLLGAIKAVKDDGLTDDDTLVFLGDYIDRGPQSAEIVASLRGLMGDRPNVICLSGNHEYMMVWGLQHGDEQLQGWAVNGGVMTIASYTDGLGDLDQQTMADDCVWFLALPTTHEDAHRVYVHAKVDPSLPLDEQQLKTVHWERYKREDGTGYNGKHVVHGHEADQRGPITVGDRTCLDTGAIWTGRYVVGVFDDDTPGGPVKVLEVLA